MWRIALFLGCVSIALADSQDASAAGRADAQTMRVYVGTYTNGKSRGIALLELDLATGKVTSRGWAAESTNPSFVAIDPTRRFLYAVNEVDSFDGQKGGSVSAFTIDQTTGTLTPLNRQSSRGAGPCHVTVDRTGKTVLVANYGGGSVASLPIGADGRLGAARSFIQHVGSSVNKERQESPHAHSINVDLANRFAVAADLGLDEVRIYRFDATQGTLTPNDPPATKVAPGAGPRHFAFHPDGRHGYVINEMHSTVTGFRYDAAKGTLTGIQTISTLPEGSFPGNSTAEVQVHPSGNYLYGSNRGHDSIAIFSVDPTNGLLAPRGYQSTGGKTPRNFGIDPTGSFLLAANQDSGTVVVFRIDTKTGRLKPTGQVIEVPAPVCVKFVPVSK